MKASYAWLQELTRLDVSPTDMAERLTRAGLEVEALHPVGRLDPAIVIAEVRGKRPHPSRDKLTLVRVFDGHDELEIVCGAPNVPEKGRVVLAKLGATMPDGLVIAPREVGGVTSHGMLASERELGIGADGDGILVLESGEAGRVGESAEKALGTADTILEIGLTPNRPDALGHLGIARELATLFGKSFAIAPARAPQRLLADVIPTISSQPTLPVIKPGTLHPGETANLVARKADVPILVPVSIENNERCTRYIATVLQRVSVTKSPLWLRQRLHALGQRSIDNIVDITNYVLLETGHPIHAFDLAKVRGEKIVVRQARAGESCVTLDDVERKLDTDDLIIADAEGPIAIAGVIGGKESAVGAATKDILLEVAWFDPRSVRRTGRRHGIHTEASHRFERGVDPNGLVDVTRRALSLLAMVSTGAPASEAADTTARKFVPVSISLEPRAIGAFLGDPSVTEQESRTILEGLGCEVSPGEERGGWRVTAPSFRPDLTRPVDLIEEVARVRGYDKIPSALLRPTPSSERTGVRHRALRSLRAACTTAGLTEAVNFAFVSKADLEAAKVSTNVVALANPLTEERSVMRTSLVPSLLGDLARSERHQANHARIFEIGRIYTPEADVEGVPLRERAMLAFALMGARRSWLAEEGAYDVYDGKGALEVIGRALGLTLTLSNSGELPAFLHPRRAGRVSLDGTPIGSLGELHPDVAEAVGLAARPILCELDAEALLDAVVARGLVEVTALPRFPLVSRDLAVVVDESRTAGDVLAVIRAVGGALVESIDVFDVYRGTHIPAGKKSLAFRIAYRDPEATLTDARVEAAHAEVVARTHRELGAELRG